MCAVRGRLLVALDPLFRLQNSCVGCKVIGNCNMHRLLNQQGPKMLNWIQLPVSGVSVMCEVKHSCT